LRTVAVTRNERRAIAEQGNPVAANENATKKQNNIYESVRDGAALIPRHDNRAQKPGNTMLNTPSIDVPICSECAER
jgi:hypothetical protein